MLARILLLSQLIVLAALALLHFSALEFHLYWRYVWLDAGVHFLGGMWASFLAAWLMTLSGRGISLVICVSAALLLGVAWELFEVFTGMPREANYAFDTAVDLLMDVVGGAVGALAASRVSLQYAISTER
ncbi:hypothetical protein COU20_00495 [Candidatus Kaiserbacteria bacterium CG10_big_fil_rev_8_21_14_0_10_59_10]|uniref:VanZ-like domain-containing protein n=1 Tax=Candidatus Kaiserbacteria bacterium CG10_big_fil_rev_8_21_14_0_10_59_10 TaxID=1974612 RepID=A0A2H0U8R1_9BACT|nr:MAG: hypothetical protein COU20_00495 [Candidatus Kaiserbacteria bacterium CG10_big_fil_rev_8_21_14_0_10_59_10]